MLWLLLMLALSSGKLVAGEVTSVVVRVVSGQVVEMPASSPDLLVQPELIPDRPFLDPLPPAPLEAFRDFYSSLGLRLQLTSEDIRSLSERVGRDPGLKDQYNRLLEAAEEWLKQPIPVYAPCTTTEATEQPEVVAGADAAFTTISKMRRDCALAFALSGDERFAQKAWDALTANIEHFYRYGAFRMVYPWESPWDTGFELYDAMAAYDMLAYWEGLRPLDHALVFTYLRRLGQQVAYAVELSPVVGSEQAMWTCNLGCLCLYAPTVPEAGSWGQMVEERMYSVMADFMGDGGHVECSPQQHTFAAEHVARLARVAAAQGGPDLYRKRWGTAVGSLEQAFDWLARIATPLGEWPAINDTYRTPLASSPAFVDAIQTYRRGDWLRAGKVDTAAPLLLHPVDPQLEAETPKVTSVLLPDSGLAIMRDGWSPWDSYLILDYGPHGGPRGHLDKLSFEMYARGQPWVLDAGTAPRQAAFSPELDRWHRQTVAHNTVLVDGKSQEPTDGALVAWRTHPGFDMVAAEHTGYPEFVHRRTVLHPRGGWFLIFDELVNLADRPRSLEWLIHCYGRRESGTSGRFVFWRPGKEGLIVALAPHQGLRGVRISEGLCGGCEDLSGAASTQSGEGDTVRPGAPGWGMIPYVGLRKTAEPNNTATFCVVLAPFQGREPELSVNLYTEPLAYAVEIRSGDVWDRVLIRKRGAPPGVIRARGLATDGKCAFVREVAGKVTVMEWVDGESLSINWPTGKE